jgi:hypothetical protein
MLAVLAAYAMLLALTIPAIAVGAEAGFEDDDGNLAPNPAGLNFDGTASPRLPGRARR